MTGEPVAVVGGTGTMGSRVVGRLLASTSGEIRVLTRSPTSSRAAALAAVDGRIRLVAGDLDDAAALAPLMAGAGWAFCNTDFFATGSVHGEVRQGKAVLEAARAAGVDRVVWSSLDSAGALTGGAIQVPHFDSKAAVAAWITAQRAEEAMRRDADGWFTEHVSILTTAPYFENLALKLAPAWHRRPDGSTGLRFTLPLGTGRYPLIALDDIAWFAEHLLHHWHSWGARDLAVVGDSRTGAEIAATVTEVTGVPADYADLPLDVLAASMPGVGHDYAALARFLQHRDLLALDRDLGLLRRLHPQLQGLRDWLARGGAAALLEAATGDPH